MKEKITNYNVLNKKIWKKKRVGTKIKFTENFEEFVQHKKYLKEN